MAMLPNLNSFKASLIMFVCIFSLMFMHGTSIDFTVGDTKGWSVPPSKDSQVYNEWAQKNRFNIDDTLKFKYQKDSVMLVTEDEYEKCQSNQPIFFSNNGDTAFLLDRPGLYYFISGVTGHCQRGQKMIVKVLDVAVKPPTNNDNDLQPPSGYGNSSSSSDDDKKKNGATQLMMMGFTCCPSLIMVLVIGEFLILA